MNDTPKFRHDCSNCVFLGSFKGADLYACPTIPQEFDDHDEMTIDTVLARFSDEPSDNKSGLSFIAVDEHLGEAFKRAMRKDMISPTQMIDIVKGAVK